MIPAPAGVMDHLEVVGKGMPLTAAPLPFVALPTTSGTGSEATKNAVIDVPAHRRKVSLRDDRMVARVAIVDPALTDGAPRGVTLASGLDALTQVIEPYVSRRANPATDALARAAIPQGIAALVTLMEREDAGGARCAGLGQPVGRHRAGECGAWGGSRLRGRDRRHDRCGAWGDLRHAAALRDRGEPRGVLPKTHGRPTGWPRWMRMLARALHVESGGARRCTAGRGRRVCRGWPSLGCASRIMPRWPRRREVASSMAANPVVLPTRGAAGHPDCGGLSLARLGLATSRPAPC